MKRGIANLIIWPSVFEKHRRTILGAQMMACRGKVQKRVRRHSSDCRAPASIKRTCCAQISGIDQPSRYRRDAAIEARHGGSGPDPRETQSLRKVRDIYVPDLHIDTLTVKARDFC